MFNKIIPCRVWVYCRQTYSVYSDSVGNPEIFLGWVFHIPLCKCSSSAAPCWKCQVKLSRSNVIVLKNSRQQKFCIVCNKHFCIILVKFSFYIIFLTLIILNKTCIWYTCILYFIQFFSCIFFTSGLHNRIGK